MSSFPRSVETVIPVGLTILVPALEPPTDLLPGQEAAHLT